MNIQSILFPTDFSQYNDAALDYASTLAADAGAKLQIVHVHDVRDISTAMGEASYHYASSWQEGLEEARKLLNKTLPTVPGVACEHHCLTGVPDEEIVAFAADKKIDLIVMASHGRSGITRLLMGSIAEGVMRKASCPVLVVKQPVTEQEASPISAAFGTTLGAVS
jgi:nucleotide-binding universal stress UspA family protein